MIYRITMFRQVLTTLYSSHTMSTHGKDTNDIQYLATYGTLRDDDNSGAVWAKGFIKDISGAISGRIHGYRLYGNSILRYPFAIHTGDAKDSIAVRLLSWPTPEQFAEKIHDADLIEGSAYERKIEEVLIEGDIRKQAYVYISKTNTLDGEWTHIPSGDWLQRVFK